MNRRIQPWLVCALASVLAYAVAAAQGQQPTQSSTYADTGYSMAGDRYATPTAQGQFVSENAVADDTGLAKRVAELEAALKKIDDKAKEDKKKADGAMTATVGGRIHLDTASYHQDAIDRARYNEQDGTEFRTARIAVYGGGFNVIKYQIEYDFASVASSSTFDPVSAAVSTKTRLRCKDTYIMITSLPLIQNVEVGHFKEPYSLDELTSDNYITFMERNITSDVLAPKRHFGIMAFGNSEDERMTAAIGAFDEYDDEGNVVQADNLGGALTMRATYLPWYDEATEGRGLIHTGVSYSFRDPYKDQFTLKYRPDSHLAKENSLTLLDVSERDEIGAEMAMVYGPLSVQSEYYVSYIDRTAHDDGMAQGAYAYVSYFLTGENRPYDRKKGVFGRVKPYENFFRVRDQSQNVYTGRGAWELKYRYSWFDGYDNGDLGWQTCHDQTFGVNWYLNPYTRLMAEYVHCGINQNKGAGSGSLDIYQMRFQIDF
ncbi:MAG: hypothetical protein LLF97_09290 [Planctomycetaceae bacterium]|nr:hypothetical protein [Planctomycetaceae bacterium]